MVTSLRELAFDAGSPYIVASNMLHIMHIFVILCNKKEVAYEQDRKLNLGIRGAW
jgi:hypothetical protein